MLEFAITFKPDKDMKPERLVNLTRQAEAAGFTYGWSFDSHIIWQDPYPMLTLMAANTERMRLGTCVTNPLVRDPTVTASLLATLNRVSHGRMDLGIGRGDSSRRVMGKKQATVVRLEETVHLIHDLTAGKQVNYQGQPIQIPWADAGIPPVWIAGYGPKVLRCAGRVAEGVIFQFADPALIQWCLGFVHEGSAHGRPGRVHHSGHERCCGVALRRPRRGTRAGSLVPGISVKPRRRPPLALPSRRTTQEPDHLCTHPPRLRLSSTL